MLEEGYSQIEDTLFDKNENRSIADIVEKVTTLVALVSNLSIYLNLTIKKLKALFEKSVPTADEVKKEQSGSIESTFVIEEEIDSHPGDNPIKP